MGKATNVKFWQIYSDGPCEQKLIKNLGENGAWAYTGTAQMFWVPPIISGTNKAMNFKFGTYIHRVNPNKSPLKFWEKMERRCIQGLPQFFWVPHIISGAGKAKNFKFGRYIHRVYPNKSPLKIWENREHGRIQGLPKFLEYPLLPQECLKLYELQIWKIYSQGPYEQKLIKNLGETGAWAYTGTAQIFWVPPIISGTDKLRTSNFVRTLLVSIRTTVH